MQHVCFKYEDGVSTYRPSNQRDMMICERELLANRHASFKE